jgi:hypothetical protein
VVGLDAYNNFKPFIKIASSDLHDGVKLDISEWSKLCEHKQVLLEYISRQDKSLKNPDSLHLGNHHLVDFGQIKNSTKNNIVTLVGKQDTAQQGFCMLAGITVTNLVGITDLINCVVRHREELQVLPWYDNHVGIIASFFKNNSGNVERVVDSYLRNILEIEKNTVYKVLIHEMLLSLRPYISSCVTEIILPQISDT